MANKVFRGDAPAVAQIDTLTPANVEVGDVFTATINGKSITFTAAAATVANVTAGIVAAWNASTIPEFVEVTASDSTTHVTLTADTAGVPFTVTSSSTGDGAPADTFTQATSTAATGPNHWDEADNWVGGVAPVNADDVYLVDCDVDILYGIDQNAVALTSLNISMSFTGKIGLPRENANGYYEYRETYLKISATTANLGYGEGAGSQRVKLNTGTVQTALNILDSGSPEDDELETILWVGTHAANAVTISKGSLGIAIFAGEVATVTPLKVGYRDAVTGDAVVRCGVGVTLTDIDQAGGELHVDSNFTTHDMTDGEFIFGAQGSPTAGTIGADGGAVRYRSAGTLTAGKFGPDATIDFRQDMRPRTVTDLELHKDASYYDPFGTVTHTNGIDFVRCTPNELAAFEVIPHRTWTPSAI